MTVPLGDCAETARPPGKPPYAAELSSGGRDFTNRAPPLASSLYAPGGITISPIAVPESFRTRDSPSPGDPTPFWRSDSLRSVDSILARKSTVSPLSEFPSTTGCDLTAARKLIQYQEELLAEEEAAAEAALLARQQRRKMLGAISASLNHGKRAAPAAATDSSSSCSSCSARSVGYQRQAILSCRHRHLRLRRSRLMRHR